MAAVSSGPAGALRGALLRIVLPPLVIAAALLSAGTWLLVVQSGALTVDLGASGTLWRGDTPPQAVQGTLLTSAA